MSPACQQAVAEVGNGIGASLRGIDCLAADMTSSAFGRLFGSGGALAPALTILLTLYIALFAYALITGRSRIGIAALTPRMVTLGLVLTFATSWFAYQSVVWNLAAGAPDQIASVLTGTEGSATQVFADKIDIVFAAVQQVTEGQGGQQQSVSTFSPQGLMWMGATLLLLGTVGVLVTSRIALAVLVAVGPIFVVMALFPATRGLFAGWLRGLVLVAALPLFAVLGGTLMLELAVPVLSALSPMPGEIDPRAAMAFFMIGAVHVALMLMVLKVAAAMVGNWSVFGLAGGSERETHLSGPAAPAAHMAVAGTSARHGDARAPGPTPSRHIAISGVNAAQAANDTAGTGVTRREIHTIAVQTGGQPSAATATRSRVSGIGSRFRAPPARQTETSK